MWLSSTRHLFPGNDSSRSTSSALPSSRNASMRRAAPVSEATRLDILSNRVSSIYLVHNHGHNSARLAKPGDVCLVQVEKWGKWGKMENKTSQIIRYFHYVFRTLKKQTLEDSKIRKHLEHVSVFDSCSGTTTTTLAYNFMIKRPRLRQ